MSARPVSPPDNTTAGWWDATREHRLTVQRCASCGRAQLYPRPVCLACGGAGLRLEDASGGATVYSFTHVQRAPHEAFTPPYVVALVRLDEGPQILTNITSGTPVCDGRARLSWIDLEDGRALPVFEMEP